NSYFRLYTTHSVPIRQQDDLGSPPGFLPGQQFTDGKQPFGVTYSDPPIHHLTLLRAIPSPYHAVGPMHRLQDPHHAPFFFQDSLYVFYIQPTSPVAGTHAFGAFPRPATALAAFPHLTATGNSHG